MRSISRSVRDKQRSEHRTFLLEVVKLNETKLAGFRKRWPVQPALSSKDLLRYRDELRLVWEGPDALNSRKSQRDISDSCKDVISNWLTQSRVDSRCPFILDWTRETKRIRPNSASLPIALAHASVFFLNFLRYCQCPDCPNGYYFIAPRRDKKFCSGFCQAWSKRQVKKRYARKNAHALKERRAGLKTSGADFDDLC